MNPRVATALVLLAALASGALVLVANGERDEPAVVAPRAAFQGARMPPGVRAPEFSLRNQDGDVVRMSDLRGTPVVVTFMYTTCEESCPPQAQQIKGALDDLGRDLPVLAIAVDPANDTADAARRFLSEQRLVGRMDFVLGSQAELRPVWEGFAIQPQSRDTEHQSRTVLVDRRGYQRVGFPLNQTTPERIEHDLRVLLRE